MKYTVREMKCESEGKDCDEVKLWLQREKLLVLIALISITNCYSEDPHEYEAESIRHIDYERDQMPVKLRQVEGRTKVKRTAPRIEELSEEENKNFDEKNQTPAEDRNWQVKPKAKRMSRYGKKVHIYIKNDEPKQKKQAVSSTTQASSTTTSNSADERLQSETQTKRTPEMTTKSDKDVRNIQYADRGTMTVGSHTRKIVAPKETDSLTDGSEHHEHIIKEKIKIKHHHHHHHHNHVKTVVKKEPYPVEKVVHVPFEKIVEKIIEKKVPYKVEVPVEKIVEKVKKNIVNF